MDKESLKQFKDLIARTLRPLFVGLRNEIKELNIQLQILIGAIKGKKEPPDVQKVTVENQKEIQKVGVVNLPETQKVEVTNQPEPIKEIKVKGIDLLFANLYSKFYTLTSGFSEIIDKLWDKTKEHIFKVKVENQIEFPKQLDVKVINPPTFKQVDQIKITNSEPSEAIPVVLTSKDRKRFYDAIQQVISLADANLAGIQLHNNYQAFNLTATGTEQFIDFGEFYDNVCLAVGTVSAVEVKFNLPTNDIFKLEKTEVFSHDKLLVRRIYFRATAGNNEIRICVSKHKTN